ncbi:disease resistance protein RGA2-like [Tripterygium wilfordii]|uniref:disease resistance protein RGA2-like n=1 Tax=Tripterygium wilfordii TaxID=458696 RepID=UPI0018F7F878|nr:disease resistance protein RGA2-like [Tripterygium wilfordii]
MGDSILSTIAENVLEKIGSFAPQQACLAWGLKNDLESLKKNLSAIKAVLLDAEEKQTHNHELRLWLERLKNVCYDAEDVLDEWEYKDLRKQVRKQYGSIKTKVHHFFSCSNNPLVVRFKIGNKIKELRERLDEIAAQRSKFPLEEVSRQYRHREREMTDSFLRALNVIGRGTDKERIMKFLLEQEEVDDDYHRVDVIPIVGIGGLGKTTLAKLVFNDKRVDEYFQLKMWVYVSEKEFHKKHIYQKMIKSLTNQNLVDFDLDQLQNCVRDQLNGKKFLLVLDDEWSVDRSRWLELIDLLEEVANGGKIIVTTRSNSVAETVESISSYKLKGLSLDDCLSLFKKCAFKKGEDERYPNLVEIGYDIVKKCGGLPLAVRTLGTLLYTKRDEHYWKNIRDNDIWKLKQKEGDILPALRLSYDELPSHLKPCLAIFSNFPKDSQWTNLMMTQVWMANGLLQSSDRNQELEDIGLEYVEELYSRSFFQDFQEFGNIWVFKMHDLVHDLALSVSQSECVMVNVSNQDVPEGVRHLSFSPHVLLDQDHGLDHAF